MPLARKPDITRLAGRRTLRAGLFAVIAGGSITSGIAAGMAASVTDLISVNLDADLIAFYANADVRR